MDYKRNKLGLELAHEPHKVARFGWQTQGEFLTLILTHPLNFFQKDIPLLSCPVHSYHIMRLDRKAPTNLVRLGGSVEDIPLQKKKKNQQKILQVAIIIFIMDMYSEVSNKIISKHPPPPKLHFHQLLSSKLQSNCPA